MKFRASKVISVLLAALLAGCSTLVSETGDGPVRYKERVAVVPFINLSETPQAGDRAASILVALLRAEGMSRVEVYLPEDANPLMYESQSRQQEGIDMAEADGVDLIVTGTVEEWRYKAGFDNEPAVGVTLLVRRTSDNALVWSGTAAKAGWGRASLGTTGRSVLQELVEAMPLSAGDD